MKNSRENMHTDVRLLRLISTLTCTYLIIVTGNMISKKDSLIGINGSKPE